MKRVIQALLSRYKHLIRRPRGHRITLYLVEGPDSNRFYSVWESIDKRHRYWEFNPDASISPRIEIEIREQPYA